MKKNYIFLLKIIISAASIFILVAITDWRKVSHFLIKANIAAIVSALIIYWLAQVFSSLRFVYVTHTLNKKLDFLSSLRVHFIGLWFNQVLPTSLGGDVVKTALLTRLLGVSIAFRAVILDRISGLMILLLTNILLFPLYKTRFQMHVKLLFYLEILSIGMVVGIFFSSFMLVYLKKLVGVPKLFYKFFIVFNDIRLFRGKYLWRQVWISLLIHLGAIFTYTILGLAIKANLNVIDFMLLVPLVFLVALMPISFAGWGARELGAVWLFSLIGLPVDVALAISISFGIFSFLSSLPGLIIFLLQSTSRKLLLN